MALERTLLENRHPEYTTRAPEWAFWTQSYNGGQEYTQAQHLFKFVKESDECYKERLKRADRNNFTKQVLDLITQYLFKELPTRKTDKATEALKRFWLDVDGKGTTIDEFASELGNQVGITGTCYVVVDKPVGTALTKLDQQQKGLFPYAYILSPVDVLDVVFNSQNGEIEQILIRETTRGEIDLREKRDGDGLKERFRLWIKNPETQKVEWLLYEKDKDGKEKILEQGSISISRVPIEKVTRGKSTYGGSSIIGDIAALDRSVYNYNSCCDQIIYDQTFSTLALEFDGNFSKFYDEHGITLGTKSVIPFPKGGIPPAFISPDASQGEFILNRIDQKTTQIYQVQNLQDTMGNSQKGQQEKAQSGVAKGWDFEKLNTGLVKFGGVLEKAEKAIAVLVHLWEGEKDELDSDLIDYPDSFDVKTLVQQLNEYNMLSMAVHSEKYRKLLEADLVKKATPKLEETDLKIVLEEIEASTNPELEAEKQAGKLKG